MAADDRFHRAQRVLADALTQQVTPCAVAEVGRARGAVWTTAAGRLSYAGDAAEASVETIFDLASLTKVIATTTIALLQTRAGHFTPDLRVADRMPAWRGRERADVTARDLLEHCAGLPGHRQYYRTLAGRGAFEQAICAEPLVYAPRSTSIYSDPGFMLLGFLLEDTGRTPLDVQFEQWKALARVEDPLLFNPPAAWRPRIAPTEDDPWRRRVLIGEVHDENAAALGGVAAHAGLFGTAAATGQSARWWLAAANEWDEAAMFVQRTSVPGSSRALGWDTMLPTSSCGMCLSPRAFGHTGYTGTSLWIDPERDLYVVLLTNRVHPTRHNEGIQAVRRAFHDAVVADLRDET
jgi:CubicO group peptidase (beta-lactamase class C family)